jgi:hypothetical protein
LNGGTQKRIITSLSADELIWIATTETKKP